MPKIICAEDLFSKVIRVLLNEKENKFLCEIGFTKTQAKIYLTLLKLGKANARTLSRDTNIPRTEVYGTLNELQKKGLVEKEVTATPYKFKATPLEFGLQIIMTQKFQQFKEFQIKTKEFLRENQSCGLNIQQKHEYNLTMIEGKQRLMQIFKRQHDEVQKNVGVLSTLQRWTQILDCCFENYGKALERGVKYRVVIEKPVDKGNFPENVQALLAKPNFELRLSVSPLRTNGAIFDDKEAVISFFPSRFLAESPFLLTNHPSFISMCQDQFDKVWKSAREYRM